MTIVRNVRKVLLILLIACFWIAPFFGESITDNNFEYSMDIPEGYNIVDYSEDGMSYMLTHPNNNVSLIVKINKEEKSNSAKVLKQNFGKLNAKGAVDSFYWNEAETAISLFSMTLDDNYDGWSVCAPLKQNDYYITLLCYSPTKSMKINEQFIMSTLNSLCTDFEKYNTPGVIVSYAYPNEGVKKLTLNIANQKINTSIDKIDAEASQFVVDLEYAVLCLYANHDKKMDAWQRYYRMIYRDAYGRLSQVSEDIFQVLYPVAHKKNAEAEEITYAQYLLSWVQNFDYIRGEDKTSADFTSLPGAISGKGSDCDSRSLLLCVLLKSLGIESLLLISPEYSHAMCVTEIEAPGQVYTLPGTNRYFIYGETTAKNVTWGMIAKDFSDASKWVPVILP